MVFEFIQSLFESSVNSEGIETVIGVVCRCVRFESSVNSEGIETRESVRETRDMFESSVNSEGIETEQEPEKKEVGLRAV